MNLSVAQEGVLLNVVYEFKYVRDLQRKDNPYVSNMVLSLGKSTSRYCSEREFNANSSSSKKQQQNFPDPSMPTITVVGGPAILMGRYGVAIREEIIKNIGKQKLELNGHVGTKTYTIETALPKINWRLKPEKKLIGKDTCQRALGKYAGREYEVWFAPGLPFSDGPWKLNGLPGLILEAKDSSNEVAFYFKEMGRNDNGKEIVVPFLKDQYTIMTNTKDYNRSRRAYDLDPEAIILAEHPEAEIHINNIDNSGIQKLTKIGKYNAIEKNE